MPPTNPQTAPITVPTASDPPARRLLDRFAERQLAAQQPAVDQPLLAALEHLGQRRPELARLRDQRRNHQQPEADQHADEAEVDDEDRRPPRQPP